MSQPSVPATTEALDWSALQQHARHVQDLQRGLDGACRQWLQTDAARAQPLLSRWVASRVHAPLEGGLGGEAAGALAGVPEATLQLWQGWLLHDAGQMAAAQPLFLQAWQALEAGTPEQAEAALGLGKTHTRSGHWAQARGWLLSALALARRTGDDALCCKAYGALGELLLRAGHAAAGFACLNTAYHLLPAGSGQRARQLNYLGSALRRLGEPLRAESVLMTSLQMARDLDDAASQWHALARLQFVALGLPVGTGMAASLQTYVPADATPAPAVARGFWRLGCGRAALRSGRGLTESLGLFEQAAQCFDADRLPMEHAWAARWCSHLSGDPAPWQRACQTAQALMQLPALPAPAADGVIDESFARLALPETNGFAALLAPLDGVDAEGSTRVGEHLRALDQLFFI